MADSIPARLRQKIFERDGRKCVGFSGPCGRTEGLTVDHILEKSRGGPTTMENLRTLCIPCHTERNMGRPHPEPDRILSAFERMRAKHKSRTRVPAAVRRQRKKAVRACLHIVPGRDVPLYRILDAEDSRLLRCNPEAIWVIAPKYF
jgi:hypothetical protein